jgi:hypothetical protein
MVLRSIYSLQQNRTISCPAFELIDGWTDATVDHMNSTNILEMRKDARAMLQGPISEKWKEAWQCLEGGVRRQPGMHVLIAFALGCILQTTFLRRLLLLSVKLCLALIRPVVFLGCVLLLAGEVSKASSSETK